MQNPSYGRHTQVKRNQEARSTMMNAGVLSESQLGPKAAAWKADGRIFSIKDQGKDFYPSFQFGTDGQPLPVIAKVLALFKSLEDPQGWRTAGWFFANNGWLGGAAPRDFLETDTARLIDAARHKIAEPGY